MPLPLAPTPPDPPPLPPAAAKCGGIPLLAKFPPPPPDDVDGPPFKRLFDEGTFVRVGRCVEVVILVNVYGGKLSSISESIMRAMCWKPDDVGLGLLNGEKRNEKRDISEWWKKCQQNRARACCLVYVYVFGSRRLYGANMSGRNVVIKSPALLSNR